ncbi:Rossmann-like and DUF2520 domain-containing protein [Micromonospora fulviviridis]|uniref:Rossmann-like and DUF2520 domain-containing protein n=1 Tax=Micromonospora fulviviridis TaxID=47860 RepID=UPI00378DFAAB
MPLHIAVIGAGRVGTVLGAALARAGHHITVVARSPRSLARARRLLPDASFVSLAAATDADLLLLTTSDDALVQAARELADAPSLRVGQTVLHTSVVHGLGALEPLQHRGLRIGSMHPAMTFTGQLADLDRLPGTTFTVTAQPDLLKSLRRLIEGDLKGRQQSLREEQRPLYHLGLVHGANHLVSLVNDACDMLRAGGITHPQDVLEPLLRAALDNALHSGDHGLTGPIARGDVGTLEWHVATLEQTRHPAADAYITLAHRTAERAHHAGLLSDVTAARLMDAIAIRPDRRAASTRRCNCGS